MVKSSRSAVKTLTINRGTDIVADRLVRQCEQGNHSKCTGWAMLRKEHSPINANYFIRCTCACHKKGAQVSKKQSRIKPAAKTSRKQTGKRKASGKTKKSRKR